MASGQGLLFGLRSRVVANAMNPTPHKYVIHPLGRALGLLALLASCSLAAWGQGASLDRLPAADTPLGDRGHARWGAAVPAWRQATAPPARMSGFASPEPDQRTIGPGLALRPTPWTPPWVATKRLSRFASVAPSGAVQAPEGPRFAAAQAARAGETAQTPAVGSSVRVGQMPPSRGSSAWGIDDGAGDGAADAVIIGTAASGQDAPVQVTTSSVEVQMVPEDPGGLVESLITSTTMGTLLGDAVTDAVQGGLPGRQRAYDDRDLDRLAVVSARDGADGFSLVDWFTLGGSHASVDAELKGDGEFAYLMFGREFGKTSDSVHGLLYGAESSRWDYEGETDVDRLGVSAGYYGAQRRGRWVLSGSVLATVSRNDFVSTTGATGWAGAQRLILKGEVSQQYRAGRGGASLRPYFDLLYATETLNAFTFSDGTASDAHGADLARVGLGLEYMTAPNAQGSRVLVRGEVSQAFGAEAITLSDGSVYRPQEDPVGSVTFGWMNTSRSNLTARIEVTLSELGNNDREEVRVDGTVDRRF